MKTGTNLNYKQIEQFASENNYLLNELGGDTIGKSFIVLEHNENDLTISFVLTGSNPLGFIYTCVYSDAKEERKHVLTSIEDIKKEVNEGETVYCGSEDYVVIKDKIGQYLIKCLLNGSVIGLHSYDNKLNGDNFYTLYN